ncbi:MAG: sigma-70 family RNA polymerase sigma factor, partial [Firmicutes bacterium]|nr:sigma-70 family RNA polymerase sigma factor [Bacillota bacterium]
EPLGQDKDGHEVALQDLVKADLPDMSDVVQAKFDRESVYVGLSVLNEREREVIWERFGLPYGEEKTQREIARELGISRSYVSRIEKRALEKLQDALKSGK